MTKDPVAVGGFAAATPTSARIRPTYARRAIGAVKDALPRGGLLVDVDAGTGILAGQLSRAGFAVTAIEYREEMLHQLRRSLPTVPAARAVAGSLPLRRHSVDMVTVGRSGGAIRSGGGTRPGGAELPTERWEEVHRVLRPGGTLVVMSNEADGSVAWVRELTELIEAAGRRAGAERSEASWPASADRSEHFAPVRVEAFEHPVVTSASGVLDRMRSMRAVAELDDGTRARLLRSAGEVLEAHPELRGDVEYPQHTVVQLWASLDT